MPDQRDVALVTAACTARLGASAVVALTAELGPAERYRRWLAVRRGTVPVVVGTRSATFAPVARPGLLAVWDDGDDLHAEPRAPYPHVRDVLLARAHAAGAALLVGGFARTAEAQVLVESGWAQEVVAERAAVRAAAPRVTALNETATQLARDPDQAAARLPAVAFEAARAALDAGRPVLVQVPRAGYLPWLSCATCRETARCRRCAGPLGLPDAATRQEHEGAGPAGPPEKRDRGAAEPLPPGDGPPSRHPVRTAAGAGAPSRRSCARRAGRAGCGPGSSGPGARPRSWAGRSPAAPCARPAAGRRCSTGCRRGRRSWSPRRARSRRPTAGTAPHCCSTAGPCSRGPTCGWPRRHCAAGSARPRWWSRRRTGDGWVGWSSRPTPALPPVQALVRWDPAWHATAELAARSEVGFPPAVRMAAVEGSATAVAEVLDAVLGAVPAAAAPRRGGARPGRARPEPGPARDPSRDPAPRERALLRVPRAQGRALAAALAGAQALRSARKATEPVRVRLDPPEVG